ncbi:hypothetical protein FisN_33Hu058 [Fistulifera solaris]|uniref:Uncharacterized protein n=1 Tax=Fistulifera solaris TaxID=1519565 RepID=A0A1Z5KRW9_FISSO|nr:hypothetical protein FisN_33Hu058 [Fistulifera solaris]|eukprot:GAX28668.1 hypothetical protein FisN_33Hu058 [Fistulifera solaris]
MDSFKAVSAAAVPDFVGLNQPDCRLCPNDDDKMALKDTNGQVILSVMFRTQKLTAFHSSFENTLCGFLRESGSTNFAHAHVCSFSFLDMPGQPRVSWPIQNKLTENTDAQVAFRGTLHELSESDMTLVDQSVISAYNEAFLSVGYGLGSLHTVADMDMPSHLAQPDCRLCPNDDDVMAVGEAKSLIVSLPLRSPTAFSVLTMMMGSRWPFQTRNWCSCMVFSNRHSARS